MKILIAGLGSIGQRHARNLRLLCGRDLELITYRTRGLPQVITPDLKIKPDATIESEYHFRTYAHLEEALAQKPDAVMVCNPNSMHLPLALAAAQAGCHLFIEKPLSHNLEGVAALTDLIEKKRLVCLVGYQLRFHPGLKIVKSLLDSGAIGHTISVRMVFGEYIPHWHQYEDYRQYHAARQDQGGGVILSQIHDLDFIYALFGLPRRVFALGGKLSSLEVDVEDTASILMDFLVAGRPVPIHVSQDYVQRPPVRRCDIVGDSGTITWDYYNLMVQVERPREGISETYRFDRFDRNQLFLDELRHFLNCLQGLETPVVNIHDGANSLKMALAAKESLATGRIVTLD
ncbi:MAG: Gfo/Idh/MocA family oxidoreductase [Thermodesulfobacteriota bacterium]